MRLRYSPTSPYVRKVMVVIHELGLADEVETVGTDVWATDTDIGDENPVGKIPALVTEDGTFTNSTLICQYLDHRAGGGLFPRPGEGWAVLQLQALAEGLIDAMVSRNIETMRRPAEFVYPGYVARQEERIIRILDALERRTDISPDRVNVATVTLAVALDYVDLRAPHLNWREGRPGLTAFHDGFIRRDSMKATAPNQVVA